MLRFNKKNRIGLDYNRKGSEVRKGLPRDDYRAKNSTSPFAYFEYFVVRKPSPVYKF